MEINWTVILGSAVASTSFFAALAWLTRSIVVHSLSKDIERFKASLQMASHEHQIRFGRLHEKQALVVAEFYEKLLPATYCFRTLRNSESKGFAEGDRQLAGKIIGICSEAYQFSHKHALYFDDTLFKKISALNLELLKSIGLYAGLDEMLGSFQNIPEERRRMIEEAIVSSWRNLEDKFTPLLEDLKVEFRAILGVPKEQIV